MIRWFCVLVWMCVIFAFSSQGYSADATRTYLGDANVVIRKLGHLSEYAILFCLVRWAAAPTRLSSVVKIFWLPFIWSVLYASSDELHQSFVPDRTPAVLDVMVDAIGALIGASFAACASVLKRMTPKT